MQGWLKLHRKLQESPLFQDPYIFKLWALCLMKAAHKPTSVLVDRQMVDLQPGQFVTGRKALCQEFNFGAKPSNEVKETTLWSWLKRLEEWGNLDIKANNKFSVVTVVKWDLYQGGGHETDNGFDNELTADCPQTDSNLTANCPQTDTNKNVKNLENEKNKELQQPQQRAGANIFACFEQEFGRPLSPLEYEKVVKWLDEDNYPEEIVLEALREAVLSGKFNFKYIDRILFEWEKANVRSLQDLQRHREQRQPNRPNAPNVIPLTEHNARANEKWNQALQRVKGGS